MGISIKIKKKTKNTKTNKVVLHVGLLVTNVSPSSSIYIENIFLKAFNEFLRGCPIAAIQQDTTEL